MFVIVEIQTFTDNTIGILNYSAQTWKDAQRIYHEKLAYAAQSELPCYAVSLIDNHGNLLESRYYTNGDTNEGDINE